MSSPDEKFPEATRAIVDFIQELGFEVEWGWIEPDKFTLTVDFDVQPPAH